ncbi:MAG: PepSY-associated TM helix domain-containing protein [Erythrobacter sp.]|uniref:PepSY-associated TM helix domain-containing protein n=1 Tax=Qipengyuania citrea TaxID=225971 RepID=UPI001A48718D|nr:PepSY-associated TM helix domain-containing protein [Qipengyuania citrea]MBL4719310.1 PepSY domain-containing protein [Erythrobacter sp.]MCP2019067.1 putative iron-regulated membrane protein [Qipengyuania citrea]MDE0902806.1 PepSY-associated TM helix domain-containing protein [Erythrobacter sp.]
MWWKVHQWVGLKLSLFMTFILFTGTSAVLSAEIDWLLQPSLRVAPASVEGPIAWAEIADNARGYPGVARATYISAPTASAFAVKVAVEDEAGDLFFLHAHPTTGDIQGAGPWVGAHRVLRNMHRHLNLPTSLGVPIVSSLAFLLLISLVTSFVVYKKWWRGFAKPLRNRDARTWWGDFHRLAGVWSLWFVALITLTSLWYFVESLGGNAPPHPRVERGAPVEKGQSDEGSLAAAIEAALEAYPGLEVKNVQLPGEEGVLQLNGEYQAVLVRPRSNAVYVDARTGEVLLTTDGRELNLHQRVGEIADPLHFGYFGGYWTKVPWFLFGLATTGLSLSGAAIYSLRIARERGDRVRLGRSFSGMWQGMGRWRWLSNSLIAIGFLFLAFLILGIP